MAGHVSGTFPSTRPPAVAGCLASVGGVRYAWHKSKSHTTLMVIEDHSVNMHGARTATIGRGVTELVPAVAGGGGVAEQLWAQLTSARPPLITPLPQASVLNCMEGSLYIMS